MSCQASLFPSLCQASLFLSLCQVVGHWETYCICWHVHMTYARAGMKHGLHNTDHCSVWVCFWNLSYFILGTNKQTWFELICALFSSMNLWAQIIYIYITVLGFVCACFTDSYNIPERAIVIILWHAAKTENGPPLAKCGSMGEWQKQHEGVGLTYRSKVLSTLNARVSTFTSGRA